MGVLRCGTSLSCSECPWGGRCHGIFHTGPGRHKCVAALGKAVEGCQPRERPPFMKHCEAPTCLVGCTWKLCCTGHVAEFITTQGGGTLWKCMVQGGGGLAWCRERGCHCIHDGLNASLCLIAHDVVTVVGRGQSSLVVHMAALGGEVGCGAFTPNERESTSERVGLCAAFHVPAKGQALACAPPCGMNTMTPATPSRRGPPVATLVDSSCPEADCHGAHA